MNLEDGYPVVYELQMEVQEPPTVSDQDLTNLRIQIRRCLSTGTRRWNIHRAITASHQHSEVKTPQLPTMYLVFWTMVQDSTIVASVRSNPET